MFLQGVQEILRLVLWIGEGDMNLHTDCPLYVYPVVYVTYVPGF
jgi:hypothetical protein